jgi:hypothetical protein
MEPAGFLPRLRKPANVVHPEPYESSPHKFVLLFLRYKQAYTFIGAIVDKYRRRNNWIGNKKQILKFCISKENINVANSDLLIEIEFTCQLEK